MDKGVSVLLVGIGGYGSTYVNGMLDNRCDEKYHIAGVVDPKPESQSRLAEITDLKVPVCASMEEFYKDYSADLAVISSPIQFHCDQVCYALSKGSNVLCEKPLSATVEEGLRMIEARSGTDKFVSIGYQWSYSKVIQDLKKDIQAGLFGKALRLKTLLLWARTDAYFKRGWAGKIKDSQGRWVLDSIANNATAHYLHNMFYVLGEKTDESIKPLNVTAELYRANPIENFDTAAVRVITDNGAELMYFATHATRVHLGPIFCYEFEKGKVVYGTPDDPEGSNVVAYFEDGSTKSYGDPTQGVLNKLWNAIDAVKGKADILCGPEAALSHTRCIGAMHASVPEIVQFPEQMIKWDEKMFKNESGFYVEELQQVLKDCYEKRVMPSKLGISWAKPGMMIKLK